MLAQQAPSGLRLSSNDCLTSLAWCLLAAIRCRPLPGQATSRAMPAGSRLAMAVDLRSASAAGQAALLAHLAAEGQHSMLPQDSTTPSELAAAAEAAAAAAARQGGAGQAAATSAACGVLPPAFFGNAAWTVLASHQTAEAAGSSSGGAQQVPDDLLPRWTRRTTAAALDAALSSDPAVLAALAAGAVAVRATLQDMRADVGAAAALVRQAHEASAAPPASSVRASPGCMRHAGAL